MSKNYKIAVLPGDGIGPEVMKEAVRVLDVVSKKFGFDVNAEWANVGGAYNKRKAGARLYDAAFGIFN